MNNEGKRTSNKMSQVVDKAIRYEPINENSFIERFVTPYSTHVSYVNGEYRYKDSKMFPAFDFAIKEIDKKGDDEKKIHQLVMHIQNLSRLIILDDQKQGGSKRHLYIGFDHFHEDKFYLYPIGPIDLGYCGEGKEFIMIDRGLDNRIPMPLQIRHYLSDGLYTTGFLTLEYCCGVLQTKTVLIHESDYAEVSYYQKGQLHTRRSINRGKISESLYEDGFLTQITNHDKGSQSELNVRIDHFYRGERRGKMIFHPCYANLNNGYLHGDFVYETNDWKRSNFPSPYDNKLEGRISIKGTFRPNIQRVSFRNA